MAKQIQIIPSEEEDVAGKSLLGLAQGILQGKQLRQANEDRALAGAYRNAQIRELQRKTEALNQPPPGGYLRDPYSGKLLPDYSSFNVGGANFGGGNAIGPVGNSSSPFVMLPGKGPVTNPNYLDPLEQKKLAAAKAKEREEAIIRKNKEDMVKASATDMLSTVGEVKKGMKYFGPAGNLPSETVPSSLFGEYGERKNWETNVNKLLSGKIVELMSQMKGASKTGATGFGALSEKELKLLQDASTALKKNLSPEDAGRYLGDIEKMQKRILGGKTTLPKKKSKYEIIAVE